MSERDYEAKPGTVWVCGLCRKTSKHRVVGTNGWDTSCFLHAILCSTSDQVTNEEGLVQECRAAEYMT